MEGVAGAHRQRPSQTLRRQPRRSSCVPSSGSPTLSFASPTKLRQRRHRNGFTPRNVQMPTQTVHQTRALLPTALVSADARMTGQRGTLVRRVDLSTARSRTHVNKRRQHEHAGSTWAPPPPLLLPACPQSNTTRRRWCTTTGGASGERSPHLVPSCSSNGGPR